MTKLTYGPVVKVRVKRLLEALLCFVDGKFEESGFKIEHNWKEEDSANPKLTVRTTLVTLELLTQKDNKDGKLTKTQIREALNLLKDFLKILEDNRTATKGSENWHFTLKLWSKDLEKNLKQFDEAWEGSRPNKSKALEDNFKSESVAIRPQLRTGPIQAPPLPSYFVERPEYSQDLKTRLLTRSSPDTRTLVISAIHGLGSVGKSTLAAALAHDTEVQTYFCDGILWATLGQQPDVLSLLSGWVQALGDYNFRATNVEATSYHLRTLLYDKAVLLVVDDAWNTKDVQAFNAGGSRCQVLVTTREAAIAKVLGGSIYSLDVMKPSQAMELLTKKLGRDITGAERQEAEALAIAVGYLPLALELASAQVTSGTPWADLLRDIQQEVARLKTFDDPETRDITDEASLKRLSLTASLNLSIQRLPEEERENFIWLGVLPEDATITMGMTATLWDITDERDALDTLQYLRSKALLLPGVPLANGTPTYRLHDLLHDLACNLLTAPPTPKRRDDLLGLGLTLADAHATFLEKYREKTKNGLWHTLPDDNYIHQHLVWHLSKAGWVEEIHQMLREEEETGRNGWYEVRERLGQIGGYISDIARAWELAEATWTEATLSKVIGLQCRYALMITSVKSIAGGLLVALVKKNVWMPEQGLTYALQIPESLKKVKPLTALADYLPLTLKGQALQAALAAAVVIQHEEARADALITLADKLPTDLLPQVLTAAMAIRDEKYRAQLLSALADKLPEALPQALTAAIAIESESERALAINALSNKLPANLLPQALQAAKSIQNEYSRVIALSALSNKLPNDLFLQALTAAMAIESQRNRINVLKALADKLPADLLPQAFQTAMEIQDESVRADALSALADKLPDYLLPQALQAARAIENEWDRIDVLKALADKLPADLLPQAFQTAMEIQDEAARARALGSLADKLPSVLPEALKAILTLPKYDQKRFEALDALSDKLPAELLLQALFERNIIPDWWERVNALIALADKLPEAFPQALSIAMAIEHESSRVHALSALADKLPADLLPQALAATRAIQDEGDRVNVLSVLAKKLPEALYEAFSIAIAIQDERDRARAFYALADKLPAELLPQAFSAAMAFEDMYYRADALSAIADKLLEALPQALTAAMAIEDELDRARALSVLASKLPAELLPQALSAAMAIEDESDRARALSALADKLPADLLPQALTAAMAIEDESVRADALSALADKLPTDLLPQALTAAMAIQNAYYRANVLIDLVNKLPVGLLAQAFTAAMTIKNEWERTNALQALIHKLPVDLLPEALTASMIIENEWDRTDALRALARALVNELPTDLLPQTLQAARTIQHASARAQVLIALASYLSQMPATQLFPLWQDVLHSLSLGHRGELLRSLEAMVPVIFALGGEAAVAEVVGAIADLSRWR